jgi:Uma2 family endonuclease
MATPAAAHVGPWTERDLLGLPDDGQRHELLEGRLLVSPPPAGRHQGVADRLHRLLANAAPTQLQTVEALGVRIPGGSLLVPDVMVADAEAVWADDSGVLDPDHVRLVVEIVSPGSVTMDRLTKPALYARAGIPALWRVELGDRGPAVVTSRLASGAYVEEGTARPGRPLAATWPFPVRLDPAELVR